MGGQVGGVYAIAFARTLTVMFVVSRIFLVATFVAPR